MSTSSSPTVDSIAVDSAWSAACEDQ